MDVKSVGDKYCFFIKLRTGRLIVAYILLIIQLIVGVHSFYSWFNREPVLKILEVNSMESWENFVPLIFSIGLAIIVSIATISSMVILLTGLHREDNRLIVISLTFSASVIILTVLFSNLSEFAFGVKPVLSINRILLHAANALFLCVTINYWIFIEMSNWLHTNV